MFSQHLPIRIQDLKDLDKGPLYPEYNGRKSYDMRFAAVSILEGGMSSGKPSMVFTIELPDGSLANVQISGEMYKMIGSALTGAEARWRDQAETRGSKH